MRYIQVTLLLMKDPKNLAAGVTRRTVSMNPEQIIFVSDPDPEKRITGAGCTIGSNLGEWAVAQSREAILDLIEAEPGKVLFQRAELDRLRQAAAAHVRCGHSVDCNFMRNHQECDCGLFLAGKPLD